MAKKIFLIFVISACLTGPMRNAFASAKKDAYPPILHSKEWREPRPLAGEVNSPGAEDSPFISPDGNTLFFWRTPDPNIPANKQLTDKITGIYISQKQGNAWGKPRRLLLQDAGKLALDGCAYVDNNRIWFCSAREGYKGINWFTAELSGGQGKNWRLDKEIMGIAKEVGELHISSTGEEIYFHSSISGGKGQYDIWASRKSAGRWSKPRNISVVNSAQVEGWPYLSQDGNELWFTRFYQGSPAVFRSKKSGGQWQEPELILSQFAGEPTLDNQGNLYFAHHYYQDGKMLESDIFVALRKTNAPD